MNDSLDPGFPRVAHDPVNDSDGASAATTGTDPPEVPAESKPDPAGFRFNLDDALARLSEPHQPIPRFKWSTVTPSGTELASPPPPGPMYAASMAPPHAMAAPPAPMGSAPTGTMFPDQESRVRPLTQPTLDPVPEIREATPVDGTPAAAHWSTVAVPAVDIAPGLAPAAAPAPAPTLDPVPAAAPAPAPAPAPAIVTGTQAFAAGASGFTPDMSHDPNGQWTYGPVGDGPPRLPDSQPAAAPPMATMKSVTTVAPKVSSKAAAKIRKRKKRSRVVRVILVFFLLLGIVGAALTYGRDYLFPEDWDKEVVPTVDALQLSSGLEFTDPVKVNILPEAEYAAKVAGIVFAPAFGAEWTTSVPRWRALGLVDGEPTVESVNAVASAWLPAHYDPVAGQIYRSDTATGSALDAAMKDALTAALVDQQTPEPPAAAAASDATTPVPVETATASLANLAVADLVVELVAGPVKTDPDRSALVPLPVPMAHRLIGAEDLGAPILESLGVVPDRAGAIAGFDVDVATVLDVPWTVAPVPAMGEGDTPDGDAAARGSDFWYTVFAAYLPAGTAADAANSIGADLYSPALRGAQQCVYGTFVAATPEVLGVLQISLVAWAELAPTQAAAQATTLADGMTVQLSTCDPGTGADAIRTPDVATALVARQIARLTPA